MKLSTIRVRKVGNGNPQNHQAAETLIELKSAATNKTNSTKNMSIRNAPIRRPTSKPGISGLGTSFEPNRCSSWPRVRNSTSPPPIWANSHPKSAVSPTWPPASRVTPTGTVTATSTSMAKRSPYAVQIPPIRLLWRTRSLIAKEPTATPIADSISTQTKVRPHVSWDLRSSTAMQCTLLRHQAVARSIAAPVAPRSVIAY